MADLNAGTIIGRLARDAEVKTIGQSVTPLAVFSVACNERRKQGDSWVDEVSFFDVNLWGKGAEALKPYLVKGKQVAVEYRLKQERWQDKDGANRSRVILIAYSVQLLGGGQQNQGGGSAAATAGYSDAADMGGPSGAAGDDIPF